MCKAVDSTFTTGNVRARIVAYLKRFGASSSGDIAYYTQSNRNTVRRTLQELETAGEVKPTGGRSLNGKWYEAVDVAPDPTETEQDELEPAFA